MGVMHIPGHSHQAPREVALEEIEAVLGDCHLCQLYQSRHNIVFGVGNPHARVMFIGEAPGRKEDLQGEPFVGAAGEDLNGILSLAGLKREDVYIANVLKCRPPGNRNPRPEEVLACSPFLREQIRSIWPDIIVTLGNPATHFVLKTEIGITKLRGRFHQMGRSIRRRRCVTRRGRSYWRKTLRCWATIWSGIPRQRVPRNNKEHICPWSAWG